MPLLPPILAHLPVFSAVMAASVKWPAADELIFASLLIYYIPVCPALFTMHASACKGRAGEMCRVGVYLVGFILPIMVAIECFSRLWHSYLIFAAGVLLMVALPAFAGIRRASARMRAVQLQRLCMVLPALCLLPRGLRILEEAEPWNWAVVAMPFYAVVLANLATLVGLPIAWGVRVWVVRRLVRRGHARAVVAAQRRLRRLMPYLYALGILLSVGLAIGLYLLPPGQAD